tara:strand:+ start:62 stop:1132 length:1071 start_codon:yes stop_codon:yes gene_type:complete
MKNKILLLPGDGVGPEITTEAVKILDYIIGKSIVDVSYTEGDIGGVAIDNHNNPFPDETLQKARDSSSILLGAVGTIKHSNNPNNMKPESGLLALRKNLDLYINLRPIFILPSLISCSSLKPEVIKDIDIIIVRELVSDIYFGEPRGFDNDSRSAFNTMRYSEDEVERIASYAFDLSETRKSIITSVDKANVLETSQLWRKCVDKIGKKFPDVKIDHMYIDNAAMQLINNPSQFDVILTGNLFGDILSDEASMLTGSIGMLPSASLSKSQGVYEPIHGSAPDIAGKNIVNPIAMILSLGMMFRYSFKRDDISDSIDNAVNTVLSNGYLTKDLSDSNDFTSTSQMGDLILEEFKKNV